MRVTPIDTAQSPVQEMALRPLPQGARGTGGRAASLTELGAAKVGVRPGTSQLREATGRVVGSVFYGTMLKMMRESGLKSNIGHGGRGEDAFAGQLDGIWAERLGQASQRGLADVLYQRLEKQQRLIGATGGGAEGAGG